MAYKIQTEKELMLKRSRKFVFEHKNTREIEGFEDLDLAKSIVLSPSWIAKSDEAKALYKKEKARTSKAE